MNEEKPGPSDADRSAADKDWAKLAESLVGDQAGHGVLESGAPPSDSAPSGAAPTAPAPGGGSPPVSILAMFALVLSLVAIAIVGMLWWQYRQFYVSLDQTDTATAQSLERVRAEQRGLRDTLEKANAEIEDLRQKDGTLGERVDAMPGRFAQIEQRLDAVQGGSFDARANLLRSEAEYYLSVANAELTLSGNWDNAISALELADGRLAELADPELAAVREAIAEELLTLRGLRLPDIEGIVFSLGRLASRVSALPLRADLPQNLVDDGEAVRDAEPGIARLWASIKSTLGSLFRVERRDDPVPQALSAAERLVTRRRLELELELARVAALRAEPAAFRSGLDESVHLLEAEFDTDSSEVDGALTLLKELRGFDIDPARPDISASLSLLRAHRNEER